MKKKIISLSAVLCALVFSVVAALQVNAETLYTLHGYTFAETDKNKATLYGWNYSETELTVPDSVSQWQITAINDYMAQNNTQITTLDLSSAANLSKIGIMSFAGCTNISNEITIPASVTSIGVGAFQDCSSISSVTFEGGLSEIPAQIFNRCSSLTAIILPQGVTSIAKLAFAGCTSLKEITIPDSVTSINSSAFKNDTDIVIHCSTDSYAHTFAEQNGIAFVLTDAVQYELGDVNMDEIVNVNDATEIQRYIANIVTLNDEQRELADVDQDGDVTINDATKIQRIIANIE